MNPTQHHAAYLQCLFVCGILLLATPIQAQSEPSKPAICHPHTFPEDHDNPFADPLDNDYSKLAVKPKPGSLAAILAEPLKYNGMRVTLVGDIVDGSQVITLGTEGEARLVSTSGVICTELKCASDNPCCNTCSSKASLRTPSGFAFELQGKDYGCSGNDCTVTCAPKKGVQYTVTAILRVSPPDKTFYGGKSTLTRTLALEVIALKPR